MSINTVTLSTLNQLPVLLLSHESSEMLQPLLYPLSKLCSSSQTLALICSVLSVHNRSSVEYSPCLPFRLKHQAADIKIQHNLYRFLQFTRVMDTSLPFLFK